MNKSKIIFQIIIFLIIVSFIVYTLISSESAMDTLEEKLENDSLKHSNSGVIDISKEIKSAIAAKDKITKEDLDHKIEKLLENY